MPRYQSHKKVWALKISAVDHENENGPATLSFEDTRYGTREVSPEYFEKHRPQAGGYFVEYDGGYESFSPADAFESGYTLL